MLKKIKHSALALAICGSLGLHSQLVLASNVDGSIRGVVTSQEAKAALAGATIVLTDKKNGLTRTLIADNEGRFNLSNIPAGGYAVVVTKPGYQTSRIDNVSVSIGGTASLEIAMTAGNVEVISVTGTRISAVDVTSTEASFNISADDIQKMPISQNLTSVALLAPGTNQGDNRFGSSSKGGLASFGGSSVAENTYYVNGLNMTNFRNGVGGATVPFTAFQFFQVKTGGYSAEFGRSTGGVVSAVTKSGGNEFEAGANLRYTPRSLREQAPDVFYQNNGGCTTTAGVETCQTRVGDLYLNNGDTKRNTVETDLYASGAIIEDTLFFYGLYTHRDDEVTYRNALQDEGYRDTDDDPYYLARLDWNINDDHSLMLWTFSDETDQLNETMPDGEATKRGFTSEGGRSTALRYTGQLTEDFSVSAMLGKVEFRDTTKSEADDCPYIYDLTTRENFGCAVNLTSSTNADERNQRRIDFEYKGFSGHEFRFGYDAERNESVAETNLSGGIYYAYVTYGAGAVLPNSYKMPAAERIVRVRDYKVGGTFKTNNDAFYFEDKWQVNDTLTLDLGIRSESFENLNADGATFIEVKNKYAPRLGLAWDPTGAGDSKYFAKLGRYFLPVASNTNVRLAGAELYQHTFYRYTSIGSDFVPVLGEKLGDTVVFGDGVAPDTSSVTKQNIEPMYSDELMLGYESLINEDWSWGIAAMHRDLGNAIDDVSVQNGLRALGLADPKSKTDGDHFVLINPGKGASFYYDADGDGTNELINLSAEQLGYPEAVRKYNSLELSLKRHWSNDWMLNVTYVWSKSYGNAEGAVKSDNGQDDAGLTTDWDYPYLMDGAYGDLPNDRRHSIKVYGAYQVSENLSVGVNTSLTSGRPRNALGSGYFPDQANYHYGDTYYVGDKMFSRGAFGRTPWVFNIDMNAKYRLPVSEFESYLELEVFNLLNLDTPTRYVEKAEIDGAAFTVNPSFGLPAAFQNPRRVQLTASIKF